MKRHIILAMALLAAVPAMLADNGSRMIRALTPVSPQTPYTSAVAVATTTEEVIIPEVTAPGSIAVTCKLVYNEGLLSPLRVQAMEPGRKANEPARVVSNDVFYGQTEVVLNLSPGTYDFHMELCNYNPKLPVHAQNDFYNPYYHVIKEDVVVSSDISEMEVVLDANTATNYVEFEAYTPNGEPYRHPMLVGSGFDFTNSNIAFETIALTISKSTYGEVFTAYTTACHDTSSGMSMKNRYNFYINDVSDKFTFSQTRVAVDLDNVPYILTLSSKGVPTSPISNAGKPFELFEEKFMYTPKGENLRKDLYRSALDIYGHVNDFQTVHLDALSAYEYPKAMVCWAQSSPDVKYDFQVFPRRYEMDVESATDDSRSQLKSHGCALFLSPDGDMYSNYNNPYFKWSRDNMKGVMCDNVPLTSLVMHASDNNGQRTMLYVPSSIGRYGEVRETDLSFMQVEVCYNGTPVQSELFNINSLNSWSSKWAADGHEPGVMTARFTNTNAKVDGIEGKSELLITYTEGQNDMCAPAVQLLSFADKNGVVTQRFTPGQDVMVEMAAGDPNGNGRNYTYMDVRSAKLEYAPYGTDNYSDVKINMLNGATASTAWAVYGGTISGATGSANGWYDVRMTLVDNEGNRSVQTVSPAFRVSDTTGIDDVAADGDDVKVTCNGGIIEITGVENPAVEIYALGGYKVLSTTGNTVDASSLPAGMYFVVVNGSAYKVMI